MTPTTIEFTAVAAYNIRNRNNVDLSRKVAKRNRMESNSLHSLFDMNAVWSDGWQTRILATKIPIEHYNSTVTCRQSSITDQANEKKKNENCLPLLRNESDRNLCEFCKRIVCICSYRPSRSPWLRQFIEFLFGFILQFTIFLLRGTHKANRAPVWDFNKNNS